MSKTFIACIYDLLQNEKVVSMKSVKQHNNINCLEHSLFVSYISYRICHFLGWDYIAASRGGLLHDLFLYNQYAKGSHDGIHLVTHPNAALKNAEKICTLTDIEKDIIVKHMWPLTFRIPKYKESFVVSIADKLCAILEMLFIYKKLKIRSALNALSVKR